MTPQVEVMSGIVKKLPLFEEALLAEGKPLSFLALLSRDYAEIKYDLVVAAPWIDEDKKTAISLLAAKLNSQLNSQEILTISRIITVESSSPLIKEYINKYLPKTNKSKLIAVAGNVFFGLEIPMAILFRISDRKNGSEKKVSGFNSKS